MQCLHAIFRGKANIQIASAIARQSLSLRWHVRSPLSPSMGFPFCPGIALTSDYEAKPDKSQARTHPHSHRQISLHRVECGSQTILRHEKGRARKNSSALAD